MEKQAEGGVLVPEQSLEHAMSSASFFCKWRAEFGGMNAFKMARLKELEDEKDADEFFEEVPF